MENKLQPITVVTLPDGVQIDIETFLIEPTRDPKLAADGIEEPLDALVSAPLLKVQRLWADWSQPHLVSPDTFLEGELPEHVVTCWCRISGEQMVLIFFADMDPSLSIEDFFQTHLEDIHAHYLLDIQSQAEEDLRQWFGWMGLKDGESVFAN